MRAAFSQRRKTVLNSLSTAYPKEQARAAIGLVGIDPRARAETLDHATFVALAEALHSGAMGK